MLLTDRPRYPIHDLFIRPLDQRRSGGLTRLRLVSESDQLLRRFGQAELIRLSAGETFGPGLQDVADEIWVLESGQAQLFWRDERRSSPTYGCEHRLQAEAPLLFFVPFGVSFGLRCGPDCLLVRFTTHERPSGGAEGSPPWPEAW